jgi:hypothetical protein
MQTPFQPLSPETEILVQNHGGPLAIAGEHGEYVLMRSDVNVAMLGISDNENAETLASVRRGLADLDAGRVQDLGEAFDELDAHDDI